MPKEGCPPKPIIRPGTPNPQVRTLSDAIKHNPTSERKENMACRLTQWTIIKGVRWFDQADVFEAIIGQQFKICSPARHQDAIFGAKSVFEEKEMDLW